MTAHALSVEEKLVGLHKLVQRLESSARDVVASKPSREELLMFAESVIILGSDACETFGPCPSCEENPNG